MGGEVAAPNAHALTLEFGRYLTADEFRTVVDQVKAHVPHVQTLRADAVVVVENGVHAAIVKLSPWSHHHPTCARNTDAADCDCGLQETLQEVDPK